MLESNPYVSLYAEDAPADEQSERRDEALSYILWVVAAYYSHYGSLFN